MKKFILLISFIIMIFSNSLSNANFEYWNDRFILDLKEVNNFIDDKDYNSAKTKIFEYIDKTNLLYCDSYEVLKKLDYSNSDKDIIDSLWKVCSSFINWDFTKSFELLKKIPSDKLSNQSELYYLYKLLEYFVYKVTDTVDWYEKLYNLEEVNSFLSENKQQFLLLFPISYNFRVWVWYFDINDKQNFNLYYNLLKDKDFYLKPFFEINYLVLNWKNVESFEKIFNYQNIIIKDKDWPYYANMYFMINKNLYEHFYKLGNEEKEIYYFLRMQREKWFLKNNKTFRYLLSKKNITDYEEIIKNNVDAEYYNFFHNFLILKSFIDGWVRLSLEDYQKLMWAYDFILNYYEENKLDIENWRVDISFRETYIDYWLTELIKLTDSWKLEVPSNIWIFIEKNKSTYSIFDVERTEDKFILSINNNVVSETIWKKNKFINIVLILLFIFILLWWVIFLTQKK